jgi:hypothetical protein
MRKRGMRTILSPRVFFRRLTNATEAIGCGFLYSLF